MEKNINGLKTKKTLHKQNIKKIKAFGEYISNQMLFILKGDFMEHLEITKYTENGEELIRIRDIRTNLTVSCDEASLEITLNMMGVN